MFKKILLVTALVASASFATWDKFPVLDQGKGQVKLGLEYGKNDDWSHFDANVGARYTVIPNLELMLDLPYRFFTHNDGDDAKADGLLDPAIGVRYWFQPMFGIFLDVDLPLGDDDVGQYTAYQGWAFHFGGQLSTQIVDKLSIGAELGLKVYTEGDDKFDRGTDLNLGAELDYDAGAVIPFFGLDFTSRITESEWDGIKANDDDSGLLLSLGAKFPINPMFSADAKLFAEFGDIWGEDGWGLAGNFYFNF